MHRIVMKKFTGFLLCVGLVGANICAVPGISRKDCGHIGITKDECEAQSCCFIPDVLDGRSTPWCFHPEPVAHGYVLTHIAETPTGYKGGLKLIGEGTSTYGPDIPNLGLEVVLESADAVRIKITDADNERWEIPESVVKRSHTLKKPDSLNYDLQFKEAPFSFTVTRKADGEVLFDSSSWLVFKDQYIELSTATAASSTTFGLGESTRLHQALEPNHIYTMWAADIPAMILGQNLYGSYPYYVQVTERGAAHGAMLMNSNGMDVILQDEAITFKTIGGIVDLYVFSGPTPAEVVQQYTAIVGRPALMPYWALGFHNCRWGYRNLSQVEEIVANYQKAAIPLDTQWFDIDYMQSYRDFTYDVTNFPPADVSMFVESLHNQGMHFVPIIDPGIGLTPGYEAYERGVREGLFLRDVSGAYSLGQVWPGPTYFPDFLHPSTQDYWTDQLTSFHALAPMDGLWIDMNEMSNFCNKDGVSQTCQNTDPLGCPEPGGTWTDCCLVCQEVDATNRFDNPPYAIHNTYGKISRRTLSVSGYHSNNVSLYNTHNLYGLTEQIATYNALVSITKKRPFVLSRSSFISTGVHSAKWTGDNGATWGNLQSSVVSLLDYSLFGVPMIGSDICGFMLNTTEELCARWIAVGAFYPFSRAHNTHATNSQELYLWESVTAAAQYALNIRYQILPYMYSLFYAAHTSGAMVSRALWMNFPTDKTAVRIDRQFMLGSGLLISPVLEKGALSVDAYFPQGLWYNFASQALDYTAPAEGLTVNIPTPLTSVNVHIAGGTILPLQQAAMTTTVGRTTPFTLLAALCPMGGAKGSLFWDNGDELYQTAYLTAEYGVSVDPATGWGAFSAVITHSSYPEARTLSVDAVKVLGVAAAPTVATLNGAALPAAAQVVFDAAKQSVEFTGLGLRLTDAIDLQWQ